MNKQTTGIIAGAAGALLLLGGGTFALWSDSAEAPAGTITAGNLNVDIQAPAWVDVSADRTDSPHAIDDIAAFRIIPGDTIEARYPVTLDLEGENMLAKLGLVIDGDEAVTGDLAAGITGISYTVLDEDDAVVGTPNLTSLDVLFASADNGNPAGVTILAGQQYTVVVSLTFDATTANQGLVEKTATLLGESALQLSQVRSGAGYVAAP